MSVWARPGGGSPLGVAMAVAGLALAAAPARASIPPDYMRTALSDSVFGAPPDSGGAFDGLPIRRVVIESRNIFEPVPPGRLAPLFRAANHFHIRTRARTVREQLLFSPGDRWHDEVAGETMRNLRALDYLFPEAIVPYRERDSLTVVVRTRDAWTTQIEFNIESTGGQHFGSVGFTERNLLGLGKTLSLSRHVDPTGVSRAVNFGDPAVLGSRLRFDFGAGKGSQGATNQLMLGVPFYAQDARYAYGVRWQRSTSVTRLYANGDEVANFDERLEETEVTWGRGRRVDGTIVRGIASFMVRDRRLGPTMGEPPGAPPDFAGGEENLHLRRLAGELRFWHPHFIERRDVTRMTGIEDYDVGELAAIKLGLSPRMLGSSVNEAYARFQLNLGADTPAGFGWAHASMESRFRWTPIEIYRQLDSRWVTREVARQKLVVNLSGIAGERAGRNFQVTVGGLNGLRAYPVRALAGTRVWRFVTEDRWIPRHVDTQLVAIGAAAFYEAARAWGPGAAGTGWYHDAGVGLRLAFPRTSMRDVVRFDLAYPIDPAVGGKRELVFSFGSSQAF